MREREVIKCPDCRVEVLIQHIVSGYAAIQPDGWWRPTSTYWVGTCACRARTGDSEGDIYRALGLPYA